MDDWILTLLQIIVGAGLLNVWLIRSRSATSYRGGDAQSLKEEFATYGLPSWAFYVVGALKVGAALALIVGIWIPELVTPAAAVVVVLMLGALAMHFKVRDPLLKALPAFLVLLMSSAILALH
ncbi:MAG: DoxX family protein [Rhodothermales bacterium]|nr:DoxX family protein [Rhodothermales bacterium]